MSFDLYTAWCSIEFEGQFLGEELFLISSYFFDSLRLELLWCQFFNWLWGFWRNCGLGIILVSYSALYFLDILEEIDWKLWGICGLVLNSFGNLLDLIGLVRNWVNSYFSVLGHPSKISENTSGQFGKKFGEWFSSFSKLESNFFG
jgi:hypothetical protein